VDEARVLKELQQRMWQEAGLLRDAAGLSAMQGELESLRRVPAAERSSLELGNLHTVAELIVLSALAREESRGAHYRNDFPKRDDAHFAKHSVVHGREIRFEAVSLAALAR
jgi:L-aspartate oxidase